MEKWIKRGLICLVAVTLLIGIAGCTSSNSNPTVAPSEAATATPVATATPTAKPVATQKPVATPAATAPPSPGSSVSVMTPTELSAVDQSMTAKGYTVITPLASKGRTADGYPMYQGMMTKDGYVFAFTVVQTDSSGHAQGMFDNAIVVFRGMGYSGSMQDDGSWYGTKTSSDTGALQGAIVMPPTDNNWIVTVLGE
jgi:hypothetical protein